MSKAMAGGGRSSSSQSVVFKKSRRLTMRDVDAAAVLYYPVAACLYEELLTDWLFDAGHSISSILSSGYAIPAIKSKMRFLHPTGLDDVLDLVLLANRVGSSSFQLEAQIRTSRATETAIRVETTHAWARRVVATSPDGRSSTTLKSEAMPAWLRQELGSPGYDV